MKYVVRYVYHKQKNPMRSFESTKEFYFFKKKKTLSVRIILETCFVVIGLLCCKLLICCYAGKNTPTHTFFKSTNEILKSCMINPLSTCLIVIRCLSMWRTTSLKLCIATKESDRSIGASLSMRRTPSLEF